MSNLDWMQVVVAGKPVPQGSMRPMLNKHTGKAIVKANNADKLYEYRNNIINEIQIAYPNLVPIDGPVVLHVQFYMPRPKSHYGRKGGEPYLKPSSPLRPVGPPDLDKMLRSVGDACTYAGVWVDDSQAVEIHASKHYIGTNVPRFTHGVTRLAWKRWTESEQ